MPASPMPDARRLLAATAAVALLFLLFLQPDAPGPFGLASLRRLPLELPAVVLLLLAFPSRALRAAITLALTLIAVLKLADLATRAAFVRPFNPVFDADLVPAAWRLSSGAVGWPLALLGALALAAAILLLAGALWWATGRIAGLAPRRGRAALAVLAAAAVALAATDAARAFDPPGDANTARLAWEHLRDARAARRNLAAFRAEAARDRYADLPPEAILPALRGQDVLLVFVESYGRAVLENPRYAPTITAALADAEARLAAAGLAMRSGFLTAPMIGGQSWLAHGSVLSGLPVDDQGRYRAMIASPRRTLLHLAQAAGWQTVAVMPAITLAWPEAGYFGYDRVLAAADLGYRGKPFNWVTMPDQFTLASLERQVLDATPRPPVFAEIALDLLARPLDPDPAHPALGHARRRQLSSTPTPPPATRPRWSGATATGCAPSTSPPSTTRSARWPPSPSATPPTRRSSSSSATTSPPPSSPRTPRAGTSPSTSSAAPTPSPASIPGAGPPASSPPPTSPPGRCTPSATASSTPSPPTPTDEVLYPSRSGATLSRWALRQRSSRGETSRCSAQR